jgi:hypothetical protein
MREIVSVLSRRDLVLLGLRQNYPPSIYNRAQQVLRELIGEGW